MVRRGNSCALEKRVEVEDKNLCEGAWTTFYACIIFFSNPTTSNTKQNRRVTPEELYPPGV